MKRRNFIQTTALATASLSGVSAFAKENQSKKKEKLSDDLKGEVLVLQATPGGIATAIGAARMGLNVTILERTAHIGGLPANGLGATDIMSRGATAGLFEEFVSRNLKYYEEKYGKESEQVKKCSGGYHFEPSVAGKTFAAMLAEHPSIKVLTNRQFDFDKVGCIEQERGNIKSIKVLNRESGQHETYTADIFVDASYEGDLLAVAGESFRIGREGREEFNEPTAGTFYDYWVGPVLEEYSTGLGDNALQAFNYRLCITNRKDDIFPIQKPENYIRQDYISLIDDVTKMQTADYRIMQVPLEERVKAIEERFAAGVKMRFRQYRAGMNSVVNIVDLPNGKTDANNHHTALISTDLPEENWPWPSSGWAWRDRFAQRLKDYILGFLWFCQNDEALPQWFKDDCKKWGLSKSEYQDNGYFPRQVYVREGRRLEGQYFFTAQDVMSENGERPKVHTDSITSSHYALDSHACRKREPDKPLLEGLFSVQVKPYTVPFGVIVPKKTKNLICPVPASASHVGFATLRMEPCWLALGQAAGVACGVMVKDNLTIQSVDVAKVQEELLHQKAKLIQFTDVPLEHEHFRAIQQLGLTGKLTEWEIKPDEFVTEETAKDWCKRFGVKFMKVRKQTTRGAYLDMINEKLT